MFPVETLDASSSYRFARSFFDSGTGKGNGGGHGGLPQYAILAVSLPSLEESNEVARDPTEKEVFVDVLAEVALVMEDAIDGFFSKELKDVANPPSIPLFCAGCFG